ncbi:carboxymuconolactone decarboxylase family protein [Bradyrhizobium prioriisuperbiae]|uniref:carboxymuconolactone decarboxylase family protein n=1 Tax=Bradyrhizobium prioriisuperbiae TaxID=2854389 RepID=UPI0028E59450|nr:carboxymuconolactone decarboxylase family protein [Bradyrhizobium prioritasuperba]
MRIKDFTHNEMSDAQRDVAAEAASGKRGRMPAPLRAWIHSPQFGARAQRLGEFLRYDTTLSPQLSELAILVTARFWTSQYEWFVHKREALKAGLDPAVVDAIAQRRRPVFSITAQQAVYDYATTLHDNHVISDTIHATAIRELGEAGVVELVGLLGYYTLVSMTLNAFEIGLPPDEAPELEP